MKVGGTRKLTIPAELGYGARAQAASFHRMRRWSLKWNCSVSIDSGRKCGSRLMAAVLLYAGYCGTHLLQESDHVDLVCCCGHRAYS